MQLWAVIVDSFRESLDRKIFWVLIILSSLIALAMASVGFDGDHVSFVFGLWGSETEQYNPALEIGRSKLIGIVVYYLLGAIVGWIGVVLMLIATAGIFPSFVEHGAIEVVLSKPIHRARLFLYKYLGSMIFVLLQAGFFVGLTFLVMGIRWGLWAPGYLLAAPLLVLMFSYVFCVSALVGVRTRSPVAAILISIGAWVAFSLVQQAPGAFEVFPKLKEYRAFHTAVRVVSWIPPKTGDFPYLAARWAGAGTSLDVMPDEFLNAATDAERGQVNRARALEERELLKNPIHSVGSSLLFEAAVVFFAMWRFSRRDF